MPPLFLNVCWWAVFSGLTGIRPPKHQTSLRAVDDPVGRWRAP